MTRPALLLTCGIGAVGAAGVAVAVSRLLVFPGLFYAAFPLGTVGFFVAAAGYAIQDSFERRHGLSGSYPAPQAGGARSRARAQEPRERRGR